MNTKIIKIDRPTSDMTTTPKTAWQLLTLSAAVLTALAAPGAMADAAAEVGIADKTAASDSIEVISVTGNRATMTRSLNEKKNTTAIVDAIAAADFGDLPGLSLADVIENITGAAGHRLKGSQNEISLRGLGSFLGYSTFNGRTLTNAGPNRAVNLSIFPSELVDKVVIYKSQQADLVEGGVSGLTEITSLRPVAYGRDQTTLELTGIYNQQYNRIDGESPLGREFTLSTVQTYTGDFGDFGFSFGVTNTDSANPEEYYGGSSTLSACALRTAAGATIPTTKGRDCTATSQNVANFSDFAASAAEIAKFDPSSIFILPNDRFYRTIEDDDDRIGSVATFQWKPNAQWDYNLDLAYSRTHYLEDRHEMMLSTARYNLSDHIIGDDHSLLYAKGDAKMVSSAELREEENTYQGGGFKVTHTPTDDVKLEMDVSYNSSYRYRSRQRTRVDTANYFGYEFDARSGDLPSITFLDSTRKAYWEQGYNAATAFNPANASSWGAANNSNKRPNIRYQRENDERDDSIFALRVDGEYTLDHGFIETVKVGARYSKETMLDERDGRTSINLQGVRSTAEFQLDSEVSGKRATTAQADQLANDILSRCFSSFNNRNFFGSQLGTSPYALYNAACGITQITQQGTPIDQREFADIGELPDLRSSGDVNVEESITALYAMANFRTEIAGKATDGNFGLRVVETKELSSGYRSGLEVTTGVGGNGQTVYGLKLDNSNLEAVTLTSKTIRALPSANVVFHLDDEWMTRVSAYRALSRTPLQDMSAGRTFKLRNDENDITDISNLNNLIDSVAGASPYIKPFMSWNADTSLEYYPSQDMAVSAALYWKQFETQFTTAQVNESYKIRNGSSTVDLNVPVSVNAVADQAAHIRGLELTGQKHFAELPEPFNGIGIKVSYNYADASFENPDPRYPAILETAGLWGFSKHVASASMYWDFGKFSVKLMPKYRSRYYQPSSLFDINSSRWVQGATYWDFSSSYKFSKTFSMSLKALNIFDEKQVMTRGNNSTVQDYSSFGPKIFFSVMAKF